MQYFIYKYFNHNTQRKVNYIMKKKYLFIGLLAGVTLLAACSSKTNKNKKSNTSSKTKIVKQEKPDKVTRILKNMTLNEKIGQLYLLKILKTKVKQNFATK